MFSSVLQGTLASVPANLIDAHAAVLARQGICIALVDVLFAVFPREERCAGTDVVGLKGGALAAVGTWV